MSNPRSNATDSPNFPIILAASAVAVSCPVDTSEDILANIPIPANALGPNGVLRITTAWSFTNNANNKTLRVRFSGIGGTAYLSAVKTVEVGVDVFQVIANRGVTNSQHGHGIQGNSTGSISVNGNISSAVDTTAATNLVITGQKATGTDVLTLESYLIELIPG